MQNMDYYSGNSHPHLQPDFVSRDPEYFSRMTRNNADESTRKKNRATRYLVVVLGLCIVSFTTGLVVGIKFSGGKEREIVDPVTRQAVSGAYDKVSGAVRNSAVEDKSGVSTSTKDKNATKSSEDISKAEISSFPRNEFPFAIRIGNKYSPEHAFDIAKYLRKKGHRVVLARHNGFVRVYAGPYKTQKIAESNLNRMNYYTDHKLFHNMLILER